MNNNRWAEKMRRTTVFLRYFLSRSIYSFRSNSVRFSKRWIFILDFVAIAVWYIVMKNYFLLCFISVKGLRKKVITLQRASNLYSFFIYFIYIFFYIFTMFLFSIMCFVLRKNVLVVWLVIFSLLLSLATVYVIDRDVLSYII